MAPMPAESTRSFISYAREDAEFALKLAADLRQAGVNVWVDRFDIPVGKNWPRAVEEALDSCGQFLLILSPVSVLSDNVMAELNSALDEKKPVFPVLYQACRLPFRVRASQYADFTADYRTGFSTLLKALAVVQAPEQAEHPLEIAPAKVNPKDGLTYVWIPPGRFQMGCSPGDSKGWSDEKPAHQVTITKCFWMGETPVTQEAWQRVMGTNPSHFKGAKLPVETVSWDD